MEGMRGLAVLLVFFVHFHGLFSPYLQTHSPLFGASLFLGTIGHAGVDLFFLLSGFLIYGIVIQQGGSVFRFLKRRVKRIYPAFLAVFLLYLALSAMFPAENKIHGSVPAKLVYIAENVLLLPGVFNISPIITVAWSLSYEFLFYLLLPFIIIGLRLRSWSGNRRLVWWLAVWVGYLLLPLVVPAIPIRFAMFFAGMTLYEVSIHPFFHKRLTATGELFAALTFIASLIVLFFTTGSHAAQGMLGAPLPTGSVGAAALSLGCFTLALFAFQFDGIAKSVFSWTPIRWMGNISYSYYLIHGLTLKALARVLRTMFPPEADAFFFVALLFLSLATTWTTATILFVFVERKYSLKKLPRPHTSAKMAAPAS
jgi:peptidoglycan/LPS O-acetylase OafA/YrhL